MGYFKTASDGRHCVGELEPSGYATTLSVSYEFPE
jgi:hypothetical protein